MELTVKRLESDADLRVWRTSIHGSAMGSSLKLHKVTLCAPEEDQSLLSCSIAPLHWGIGLLPLPNPKQPVLSLACTQIIIKLIRPEIERTAAAT